MCVGPPPAPPPVDAGVPQAALTLQDEPDALPALLPSLTTLSSLLHQCRFPAFWRLFRSEELEGLRDNYTVECVGFEDAVREVAIRAVRAAFQRIGRERLGSYLDLQGMRHLKRRNRRHADGERAIRGGAGRVHCTPGLVAGQQHRGDCHPSQSR